MQEVIYNADGTVKETIEHPDPPAPPPPPPPTKAELLAKISELLAAVEAITD